MKFSIDQRPIKKLRIKIGDIVTRRAKLLRRYNWFKFGLIYLKGLKTLFTGKTPWPPLTKRYKAQKRKKTTAPILVFTGKLLKTLKIIKTNDWAVWVGTSKFYAKMIHKKRPFLLRGKRQREKYASPEVRQAIRKIESELKRNVESNLAKVLGATRTK